MLRHLIKFFRLQTFELLTGRWLFHPEAGDSWTLDDDHLAKILELTGDNFSRKMLNKSPDKDKFFDEDGKDVVYFYVTKLQKG